MSVPLAPSAGYAAPRHEGDSYRAISPLAVTSLALGVLSAVAVFDWSLAIVPAVALLAGVEAWRRIRLRPEELTGGRLATFGVVLAVVFWSGAWSRLVYVHLTEVPEGFVRLSYDSLQPDPNQPAQLVPATAEELNGQQVFVKGYIYPGLEQSTGVKQFLLVRHSGDCCFGGNPRLTDMMLVTLRDPLRLTYTTRLTKVAGKFRVERGTGLHGLAGVVYHVDDAWLP